MSASESVSEFASAKVELFVFQVVKSESAKEGGHSRR